MIKKMCHFLFEMTRIKNLIKCRLVYWNSFGQSAKSNEKKRCIICVCSIWLLDAFICFYPFYVWKSINSTSAWMFQHLSYKKMSDSAFNSLCFEFFLLFLSKAFNVDIYIPDTALRFLRTIWANYSFFYVFIQ